MKTKVLPFINSYGVVKGISPGETYVKVQGHPERYKITVTASSTPEVLPGSIELILRSFGYVYDHTPIDYIFDVPEISDESVTIISSAPEIARIIEKEDGYFVEGTKVSGSAKITVFLNSDFNVYAEQTIEMKNVLPSGLSLESSKTEVNVGANLTINPTFIHSVTDGFLDELEVTDKRLTFTSSNPSVASVSASNLTGIVLGKKVGETVITATSVAIQQLKPRLILK